MSDEVEQKDATPAPAPATERRVYNLPADLLQRLRGYQVRQNISSEAEAARRLLDSALQMQDTARDILNTLKKRYQEERDLRVLAGDVLTKHTLVASVSFGDGDVSFTLSKGERGKITSTGRLYYGHPEAPPDDWSPYPPPPTKSSRSASWDAGRGGGDLDDEIPF